MTARSALLSLLLVTPASACTGADLVGTERSDSHAVRTDSTAYHLVATDGWDELTIGVTYTNATLSTVQLSTCVSPHPPLIEKLTPEGWVLAYNPPVPLCLGVPYVIRPGERFRMSYRVIAARHPHQGPRFDVDEIPGTYRLNWTALRPPSGELPERHRTSNTFEIRL